MEEPLLLAENPGYLVYLLYWYKSTNTDAADAATSSAALYPGYSVYSLYWYKSTNADAVEAAASSVAYAELYAGTVG
jgi:hypothetical protein